MEVGNNKIGSLDTEWVNQSSRYRGYSRTTSWPADTLGSGLLLYQDWVVSISGYNQQKSTLAHLRRQGGCHGALKHQGFAARVSSETHTAITL